MLFEEDELTSKQLQSRRPIENNTVVIPVIITLKKACAAMESFCVFCNSLRSSNYSRVGKKEEEKARLYAVLMG